MTPDCTMSPTEQEAPDLSCKWMNCSLNFDNLEDLVSHLNATHVTSQHGAFFCLWAGCARNKGFNARYKMLIHIRTHTNERPYVCSQCDKRFSRQENLRIHARTHTGEKPYVCTVAGCGKAYSNSSDRFKHTRTHFVDKPYECRYPGCGKRYTDPSSLRKHVKIYNHSKKPEDSFQSLSPITLCQPEQLMETSYPDPRLNMTPSPSSSGSSLGAFPTYSTPSPYLTPPLLPNSTNGMGGVGASGLPPWSTPAAWTVAFQQYQTLLQGSARLAWVGMAADNENHVSGSFDNDIKPMENSAMALDLSVCSSPLDLSLPSARRNNQ